MDERDFTFMESGFNGLQPPSDEEFEKNATTMIVTYAAEAMKTAAKYLSHGSRNVVTPEDIKRAMMLEIFLFNKRTNLLETATEIRKEIYGNEDEGEDDDDEFIIEGEEKSEDKFKENDCTCAMCSCLNTIYTKWETFEPETMFEKVFKKHIENIN